MWADWRMMGLQELSPGSISLRMLRNTVKLSTSVTLKPLRSPPPSGRAKLTISARRIRILGISNVTKGLVGLILKFTWGTWQTKCHITIEKGCYHFCTKCLNDHATRSWTYQDVLTAITFILKFHRFSLPISLATINTINCHYYQFRTTTWKKEKGTLLISTLYRWQIHDRPMQFKKKIKISAAEPDIVLFIPSLILAKPGAYITRI